MKDITYIKEKVRRSLGITRDEYALLQYIQYRCADPRQSMPGWCDDDKELIAEHVEISRPGLYKMIDRMEQKSLLERIGIKGNLRVTQVFFDAENQQKGEAKSDDRVNSVDTENEKRVNSVDTPCKLSLHDRVNSVDTYNKVKKEVSKKERRSNHNDKKSDSKSEKNQPSNAGLFFQDFARVDVDLEAEKMLSDTAFLMSFSSRGLPTEKAGDYVRAFCVDVKGRGENYNRIRDFRSHCLNWCERRHNINKGKAPERTTGPNQKMLTL